MNVLEKTKLGDQSYKSQGDLVHSVERIQSWLMNTMAPSSEGPTPEGRRFSDRDTRRVSDWCEHFCFSESGHFIPLPLPGSSSRQLREHRVAFGTTIEFAHPAGDIIREELEDLNKDFWLVKPTLLARRISVDEQVGPYRKKICDYKEISSKNSANISGRSFVQPRHCLFC